MKLDLRVQIVQMDLIINILDVASFRFFDEKGFSNCYVL